MMMHAQLDAVGFYERLDWLGVGEVFYEADIAHLLMIKPPRDEAARRALLALTPEESFGVSPSIKRLLSDSSAASGAGPNRES